MCVYAGLHTGFGAGGGGGGGQIELPKMLGGGGGRMQYGRYNIGLQRLEGRGYFRWQCYVWGWGIIQ